MTTALAERPAVTADELDLVRRTVANGATDAELKLYLFDCARQGVHPLDRLLHFTKRDGRYVPVTSIDLMRTRAADTDEYAGSDDAVFTGTPVDAEFAAHVTVWRLVQGQRCAFTSTARWSEYKPAPGASGKGDQMWRKMPHTMLAKCAEALALRKGFPRQLAGLYAKEELDQAAEAPPTYVVEAPAPPSPPLPPAEREERENVPPPSTGDSAGLLILSVEKRDGVKNGKPWTKWTIRFSDGRQASTFDTRLAAVAENCARNGDPIGIEVKETKWGMDLKALWRLGDDAGEDELPPLSSDDIPF